MALRAIADLGPRVRIEGNDLVVTYRETTVADPGVSWLGEWSQALSGWLLYGVRYQEISTHTGYRMVEARVARNREAAILFRLRASR